MSHCLLRSRIAARRLALLMVLSLMLPLLAERPSPGQTTRGDGPPAPTALAMTPGIVCSKVEGIDRVTPVADSALTNLDKLKVYFCPLHYKVETDLKQPKPYRVRFTEDGRIRRKGEKTPLAKEDKLLEYESRFEASDERVYLVNVVGLDRFPPGEYEFDITLHDEIDGTAVARQTVPFRIIPVAGATAGRADPATPPAPAPPAPEKKGRSKSGRPTKRPD